MVAFSRFLLPGVAALLVGVAALLVACGGGGSPAAPADGGGVPQDGGRDGGSGKPIAVARVPSTANVFEQVTLDGRESFSPIGEPITGWFWVLESIPAASQARILDQEKAVALIIPDRRGAYRIRLRVFTETAASDPVAAELSVFDECCRPVANGGGPYLVALTGSAVLDGSASRDPRNQALRYRWEIVAGPDGHAARLTDASRPIALFMPDSTKPHAHYEVRLTADNGQIESDPDVVSVDVANGKPTVSLGPNRKVQPGDRVTLNATAADSDGDRLSWGWSLVGTPPAGASLEGTVPPGPTVTLQTDRMAVDVDYVVEVVVNDGFENSIPARVTPARRSRATSFLAHRGWSTSARLASNRSRIRKA